MSLSCRLFSYCDSTQEYCDKHVGLFVCLSTRTVQKPDFTDFTKCSIHVAFGRGSVLLWRRCDTACTSGFLDDAMLARDDQEQATRKRRILKVIRQVTTLIYTVSYIQTDCTWPGSKSDISTSSSRRFYNYLIV